MSAIPLMRLLLAAAALAAVGLAVMAGLDRLASDQRAAERRALQQRTVDLAAGALAPGSALACLDGAAGETIEQACEAMVFANPQSAAAAVAFTGARLTLLADAHAIGPEALSGLAAARRAVELDRFGIAAHVLAVRDGCTAERCAGFALVADAAVLKANLRSGVFDQYVGRHAPSWNKPGEAVPPVAEKPAPDQAPVAALRDPQPPERVATGRNNLPKTTIPPVSIMDTEPPLPKEAAAANASAGETASDTGPPLPPRRPAAPAASPTPATPPAR